jgi:hypothetical protein
LDYLLEKIIRIQESDLELIEWLGGDVELRAYGLAILDISCDRVNFTQLALSGLDNTSNRNNNTATTPANFISDLFFSLPRALQVHKNIKGKTYVISSRLDRKIPSERTSSVI